MPNVFDAFVNGLKAAVTQIEQAEDQGELVQALTQLQALLRPWSQAFLSSPTPPRD